jgi:hypothetical protein
MDSSVSPKDEICFLRVCHHILNAVYSNILYRAREGHCGLAFHDTISIRQYDSNGISKWRAHQVDHRLVNAFCELWFRRSKQVVSINIFFWDYVKDYLGPSVAADTEQFQLQVTKTWGKRHQVDKTELLETLIGHTLNFINLYIYFRVDLLGCTWSE